jgi:hypothetical protein
VVIETIDLIIAVAQVVLLAGIFVKCVNPLDADCNSDADAHRASLLQSQDLINPERFSFRERATVYS